MAFALIAIAASAVPGQAAAGKAKGFAAVNGTKLYYEIAGKGPIVVFTHGGLVDSRLWDEQFKVFAKRFRVVRYDLRGY
jgi:3-oxoadipate enol-lactonase